MVHIRLQHFPFALALLPFLITGIVLPVVVQDWLHGRLESGGGRDFLLGLICVGLWECAILTSIRARKRRGYDRLLGRELSSWKWAPPVAFAVGVVSGLIFVSKV
jgi:hypothetical protein